jgi:DNA polymerase III epsilon subunit-like protein
MKWYENIIETTMPHRVFSENVVFFDAEFTSLDPRNGEILSIAIIKPSGEELYLEVERKNDPVHPWVKENILPLLDGNPITQEATCERIEHFIGDSAPYLISYVSHFDTAFLHKLFGDGRWPFHRDPIDFASMLFSAGLNPTNLLENDRVLSEAMGVEPSDACRMHHALNDARLLRDTYGKFLRYISTNNS